MRFKKLSWMVTAISAISLFSCNINSGETEVEYLPFQSTKDGKWGLIGTDGKVLFEEEFKDAPTVVTNDRFMVQNANGMWEVYTAEEKPERIGDEYVSIVNFTSDVTPAVKKNEKITLIDKNGVVKATLDKVGKKNIVKCTGFAHDMAIIATDDDMMGVIDTKGNVLVEPKHKATIIIDENTIMFADANKGDESSMLTFVNKAGEVKGKLNVGDGQKYADINFEATTDDIIAVATKVDGEKQWGFITYDKEVKLKPSGKIRSIESLKDDKFIFRNEDGDYGVMNLNGETILRAKYDVLTWASDDLLIAYDNDDEYSVINLDGDKLTVDKYYNILPFYDNKHAAVKVDDNSWGFINSDGTEMKEIKTDIYDISLNIACSVVETDFVDIDALVASLKLEKLGMYGMKSNMSPLQMTKAFNDAAIPSERKSISENDNYHLDRLKMHKEKAGIDIFVEVYYTDWMVDYVYGLLQWTAAKPTYIRAEISGSKVNRNANKIYSKIAAIVKQFGSIYKENSGAVIVKQSEDFGWIVINDGDEVKVELNNYSYQWYDISRYAKNGEDTKESVESKNYSRGQEDKDSSYYFSEDEDPDIIGN